MGPETGHSGSGKGKPSIHPNFNYWETYLGLWRQWAKENPNMIKELSELAEGKVLTDQFANTENNQARALSVILNEQTETKEVSEEQQGEEIKKYCKGQK